MKRANIFLAVGTHLLAFFLISSGQLACATGLSPGYNLMHLQGGALVIPDVLPTGTIPMQSRTELPSDSLLPPSGIPSGLGNTDTIIQRTSSLAPGTTGPINSVFVAVSLVSVSPVDVSGTLYDVHANLDTSETSDGVIDIATNTSGMGLFNSSIDLFVKVTLVEDGNPSNQMPINGHSAGAFSSGVGWSHDVPPLYPDDPAYPSGGFFFDSSWQMSLSGTGDHPISGLLAFGPAMIIIPEPSALLLALCGMGGFGIFRPRRRRA